MTLEEMLESLLQPQPVSPGGGPGEIVRAKLADPSAMPRPDSGGVMYGGFGSMVPALPNTQGGPGRPPVRVSGTPISTSAPNVGTQSGPAVTRAPGLDRSYAVPDLPASGTPYRQPEPVRDDAYSPPVQPKAVPPSLDLPSTSSFGAFLRGLGQGNGALLPAIGEGMGAVEGVDRNRLAQNKTYQWLMEKGSSPEEAATAISNPELLKNLITVYTNPTITDDQREYKAAQAQGYKGTLLQFIKEARRTNALKWVNTGTMMEGRDPVTGEIVQSAPIDISGKAAAQEAGEAKGKAQVNLPMAELNAGKITTLIDNVLNDPYLHAMTGYAGYLPNVTPDAQRVQAHIDQLQGRTFLQAFNDLRGGGAITEKEGEKATQSYNRLSAMKVSDPDYRVALNEFRQDVADLLEVARKKAGGGTSVQPAQTGATPPTSGQWSIQRVE
jgi:hypothetical protein